MNGTVLRIAKIVIGVASVGLSLATSYFADKELDAKVSTKVAEALAKATEGES